MNQQTTTYGLLLACKAHGTIVEVYYNDLPFGRDLVGTSLMQCVASSSMGKAMRLLTAALNQMPAMGWEMTCAIEDGIRPLCFTAVSQGQTVLVAATPGPGSLEPLLARAEQLPESWLAILQAHVNQGRDEQQNKTNLQLSVFDEMTRLNNELANIQRELTRKNLQLQNLNEQKNQFLGMAAHDMRNPLATIMGYAQFLYDQTHAVLNDEHREFLQIIQRTSEFMVRLVNDFLDVSSIESGKLHLHTQYEDVVALVQQNVTINQTLVAKKDITLHCQCVPDAPLMQIDKAKMEQVLNNLISNAAKFSERGTAIHVTLRRLPETIEIAVRDEGQGIPADELPRLFAAYATTSVKSTAGEKSTGLGLSIVKRIVEGHGGRIWVDSVVGEGTTFTFALPIPADEIANEELPDFTKITPNEVPLTRVPASEAEEPEAGEGISALRVLVVEDSVMFQRVLGRMVRGLGCAVKIVGDAPEVLPALEAETFDVVLMDTNLPNGNGLDVARDVRATSGIRPTPYIISISGSTGAEQLPASSGIDAVLCKPFKSDALLGCLEEAITRRAAAAQPTRDKRAVSHQRRIKRAHRRKPMR